MPTARRPGAVGPAGPDADGYDELVTTRQWGVGAEPVDKSTWQKCHACGRDVPARRDRHGWTSAGELRRDERGFQKEPEATGTFSYVCPFCYATQVNEVDDDDFTCQKTCHVCSGELDGAWLCPHCGTPRAWVVVGCPFCGFHQAVQAPHLAVMCDAFTLECVRCEQRYLSLCIC